ncbi:fibroblast growth factor receptor homolog 2 [Drosophila biarmipes]|uniref:fibroblast growth factor receptor homolog 2 n=1 Tax=Drosophila biarmipes TaxID=125945 RepID=UPI0007E8911C|nr:fibroblast growth factor receptor homolog 2 [Drosophila biarmipes]
MAVEGKCFGSIATPILVLVISISRAWTMQHQHLSPAIQLHPETKSLSNIVDGNNNLLPIVSAPSSVDNDYVYIASVNSKFPQFGNALDEDQEAEEQPDETTYPPPVFDFGMPRNITTRTGHTAAINCRVDNLGDKSVSWIRKRDLHILTAGILTYTSDERFKVVRTVDSKDWTLHVKYAQPRDSGIYECQVNTEPKISMAFRLNVIVTPPDAKAIIAGPTDLYVKVGSSVTLTCLVKQPATAAQDIGPIYWYRGPYILTPFVAHPNDAAIDLQRISMESTLAEKLQSRLRIANAQLLDSGNYTCMPTTAEAASVVVNVINDESPAAMQKSRGIRTSGSGRSSRLVMLLAMVASCVVRWLIGGRHTGLGISSSCRAPCSNLSTLHINYRELTSHLERHRCLGQSLAES